MLTLLDQKATQVDHLSDHTGELKRKIALFYQHLLWSRGMRGICLPPADIRPLFEGQELISREEAKAQAKATSVASSLASPSARPIPTDTELAICGFPTVSVDTQKSL